MTFRLRRTDDRLVKTSLPGQYVTVQVPMPDGVRQPRQYSLTRADDGEHRQFSVKRVRGDGKPDGEVSNLLCDTRAGRRPADDVAAVRRRRPRRLGRPVVFASAGIGITPMAGHAVAPGRGRARTCRSPCCTPTPTRHRSRCASRSSPTSHALPDASAHVWYERGADSSLPVDVHAGPDEPRRRQAARRRRLLPVRAAAVHAGGPQRPDRPGRARARHPVRGVRARPVAGRPRHRGDAGRRRPARRRD